MGWYGYGGYGFKPYVSAAERRAKALLEIAKLTKQGQKTAPVKIEGRKIAQTFWGKGWCDHMESFSDFSNRLPRGRTYIRNGSVLDLQIEPGQVSALVMGSSPYKVKIKIAPLPVELWSAVKSKCAGQIGTMVELLQGKFSKSVMEAVTCREDGLFPKPRQIEMDCSCPDYAGMCKHIAAVLYGIGARLDEQPELLFKLRKVDHLELISQPLDPTALDAGKGGDRRTIDAGDLADVFGIEQEEPTPAPVLATPPKPKPTQKKSRKPGPRTAPKKAKGAAKTKSKAKPKLKRNT